MEQSRVRKEEEDKRRDRYITSVNGQGKTSPQPKLYLMIAINGVDWCGCQLFSAPTIKPNYRICKQ